MSAVIKDYEYNESRRSLQNLPESELEDYGDVPR